MSSPRDIPFSSNETHRTVDRAAKALELLSAFSFQTRRLSLGKLASRTGIPRDGISLAVHARGRALRYRGAYQPGLKCFILGNASPPIWICMKIARPHLVALRDATRETTGIAILDHCQVVY